MRHAYVVEIQMIENNACLLSWLWYNGPTLENMISEAHLLRVICVDENDYHPWLVETILK